MVLNNVRIKEDITPELIASAIESVVDSCFINGVYNPYYQSFGERIAVVRFFLDGIELEENDSLYMISQLDEVKKLVDRFFGDARYSNPAQIMSIVKQNADQIIEYKKQRLIHGADAIEYIANTLKEFREYVNTLDLNTIFNNLSSESFADITQDDINKSRKIVDKIINGEIDDAFIDAVKHDLDKESQEIIDAKNTQIVELTQKTQSLEKKLAEIIAESAKKEDDGK